MYSHGRSGALERVVFVLDGPRDIANVGAVVRLLGNFGLSRLRLVEPAVFDAARIRRLARRGETTLSGIERHGTLEAALADCTLVLGTTRRERSLDRPVLSPRQAASALLAALTATDDAAYWDSSKRGLAAVLFGPEDFGLSNAALDHCHAIVTVPAVPADASLNLAQAAVIVAYELYIAASEPEAAVQSPWPMPEMAIGDLAGGAELDTLFEAFRQMLIHLYVPHIEGRTNMAVARLRALMMRALPRKDETQLITTILQHVARELANRET